MSRDAPLHVLIVEDNEDDVFLIHDAFAEAKLAGSFEVVRDGIEAMQYLRREGKHKDASRPGLVLLDINMPKKNGFEVLRELKSDPELQHVPVIILTTSDAETDVVKAYAWGASSYITKPADFKVFQQVVKQFAQYWTFVSRIPGPTGERIDPAAKR